jgi:hypothetical protein
MSDDLDDMKKLDWLHNIINDGIFVPWTHARDGELDVWKQFEDHYGGWWDTDLDKEAPDEKAFELASKLEGCTPPQLEAITTLLYLAIKTTRVVCDTSG